METETLTLSKRQAMLKKIKALLAKTVQSGCTESEALKAAELAAKLQRDYNIDLTEAEVIEEGFDRVEFEWMNEKTQFIQDRISYAIGKFTSTRPIIHRSFVPRGQGKKAKKGNQKLYFFGFASDTSFAAWLLETLTSFIERNAQWHVNMNYGDCCYTNRHRSEAWRAFVEGMCDRISRELMKKFQPTQVKATATGTALIVLDKLALVSKELEKTVKNIKKGPKLSKQLNHDEDFYAGWKEGGNAQLNRPLEDNSEQVLKIAK